MARWRSAPNTHTFDAMSATPPGLRALTIGAAGVTLASAAALVGGLAHMGGLAAIVVAVPLFSLGAMVVAPAVAYLHARRGGGPIPRGLRYATAASAILVAVLGLWLAIVFFQERSWLGVGIGALVDVLGAWLAGRVLSRSANLPPAPDPGVRRYLVPSIAGCAVTLIMSVYLPAVIARGSGGTGSYQASMRSDLNSLLAAEDVAHADSGHFTLHPDLRPTDDAANLEIRLTADGYQARIGHRALDDVCVMYVGTIPIEPARNPGAVTCTGRSETQRYVLADIGVLAGTLLLGLIGLVAARLDSG
jgi:hypothetical protein